MKSAVERFLLLCSAQASVWASVRSAGTEATAPRCDEHRFCVHVLRREDRTKAHVVTVVTMVYPASRQYQPPA
jgi:hypothetical protein